MTASCSAFRPTSIRFQYHPSLFPHPAAPTSTGPAGPTSLAVAAATTATTAQPVPTLTTTHIPSTSSSTPPLSQPSIPTNITTGSLSEFKQTNTNISDTSTAIPDGMTRTRTPANPTISSDRAIGITSIDATSSVGHVRPTDTSDTKTSTSTSTSTVIPSGSNSSNSSNSSGSSSSSRSTTTANDLDYHIRVNTEFEVEEISEMERQVQILRERIDKKRKNVDNFYIAKQKGVKKIFHQQIERLLTFSQQHDCVNELLRRWVLVQFAKSYVPNISHQFEKELQMFDTMLESSVYRHENADTTSDHLTTLVSNLLLCNSDNRQEPDPSLSLYDDDDADDRPSKRPRVATTSITSISTSPPSTSTSTSSSSSLSLSVSSSPSSSTTTTSSVSAALPPPLPSSLTSTTARNSHNIPSIIPGDDNTGHHRVLPRIDSINVSLPPVFTIKIRLGDGVSNNHYPVSGKGNDYIFQGDFDVNPGVSLRENIKNIWSSTFRSNIIQSPEPAVFAEVLKFKLYLESDEYDKVLQEVTDVKQLMVNETYMLCLDSDRNISRNISLFVYLNDNHSPDTPIQPLSSFTFAYIRFGTKDKMILANTIRSILNIPETSPITMIRTNSSNLAVGSSKRYIRVVRSPYSKGKNRHEFSPSTMQQIPYSISSL